MQIVFFSPIQIILMDILAWIIIQLSIGYLSSKIPLDWLNPNEWFFQTFIWEKDGDIYQTLFHIRSWKHLIPNGSALYRDGYSIKHLTTRDPAYVERWLKESLRSEICHWAMVIPSIFFFIWNNVAMGWGMVAYALVSNLVPIILQRYNRPRTRKLQAQLERKTQTQGDTYVPQQELSHSY